LGRRFGIEEEVLDDEILAVGRGCNLAELDALAHYLSKNWIMAIQAGKQTLANDDWEFGEIRIYYL